MESKIINVGKDFHHRLANRDEKQGDKMHTAVEFRAQYLKELDAQEAWRKDDLFITFDFSEVKKIGPSFANEAFAFFTSFAKPKKILNKIRLINITTVQKMIIEEELNAGYYGK